MEGNVLITLLEPGQERGIGDGRVVTEDTSYEIWALREDRSGRETVEEGVEVGNWESRFQVRRDGLEGLTEKWGLVDDRGIVFDIERVSEAPIGFKRWWHIFAVRRG